MDRAWLGVHPEESMLNLSDEKREICVLLGVNEQGPDLALYDERGRRVWGGP